MSARIPGKYGRRPAKNAPALRLGPLLTGVVPAHPVAVDYLAKLTAWQMLGNDTWGDCVAVTWANLRRLVTAVLGGHEVYPDLAQVEALYKTQNPGFPAEDNGMDIQTCLEHLVTDGGPDGVKAVAFAKVDHTNQAEVDAALAIFGSLWIGITVLAANQDEFRANQPWDYVAGSPVDGGHSVLSGGYDATKPSDDVRFITWGAETSFTDAFWSHEVDEAWVVIWPEHLGSTAFLEGVDQATFAADFKAVTGHDPVWPTPTPIPPTPPAPTPQPNGCLDAADKMLFGDLKVLGWLAARHSGPNRKAAELVRAWAKAKGLL